MKLADIQALAATLPVRHILAENGTPYLDRYKLHGWTPDARVETPCSVYLHHIHRPDLDEALHSHPWDWSQTMILVGGYEEQRGVLQPDGSLLRLPNQLLLDGQSNEMAAGDVHRIVRLVDETWTLFMAGPKASSWGFYVEGRGLVPWRQRLAERGLVPDYPLAEREKALGQP